MAYELPDGIAFPETKDLANLHITTLAVLYLILDRDLLYLESTMTEHALETMKRADVDAVRAYLREAHYRAHGHARDAELDQRASTVLEDLIRRLRPSAGMAADEAVE